MGASSALIGWHWCHRLLPWDNDVDLCVLYPDLLKLKAAAERQDLYD
ncbi:LicD family protein [Luteolibacter pohnpeiensis]|uniref:LicD family protein n=1 Tax=Luteolibacter pohnpeiensis TaxID=454153 RepID=A0A934SDT0_9BACT|nr:LicD family protein [Luteolibacter pohnpeiensis]